MVTYVRDSAATAELHKTNNFDAIEKRISGMIPRQLNSIQSKSNSIYHMDRELVNQLAVVLSSR
jgi:hypothetical protein